MQIAAAEIVRNLEDKLARMSQEQQGSPDHIDVLNDLAWELAATETRRSMTLTRQAQEMSGELSYKKGIAYSLRNIGYCQMIATDLDKSLKTTNEALDKFRELQDEAGEATALDSMALNYWRLGSYEEALKYSNLSLNLNKKIGDQRGEAWALHNIGAIFFELGDDGTAIETYDNALKIFKEIKYSAGETRIYMGLGEIYSNSREYDKALHYYEQALLYSEKFSIALGTARALTDIGKVYQNLQRYDDAVAYHRRSLELFDQFENKEIKAIVHLNLGSLFLEQESYQDAQTHLETALQIIDHTQAKPTASRIHQALAELFEKTGAFSKALLHIKALYRLQEEVFSEESSLKLKNLQIRMEVQRAEKEAEINRLKYVDLANMQAQLVQTEKMALLGNLVAGIAHEVNTPLAVINSNNDLAQRTLERIAKELKSLDLPENQNSLKAINVLINNNKASSGASKKIIDLINNLKNFSRLDQADFQLADIHEGIENTLSLIASQIPPETVIVKKLGKLPQIECYPQELNQVFMTLFINAIEAVDTKGMIEIETTTADRHVDIRISDDGKGIPTEALNNIFEIGFSAQKSKIRMNVGLANSYNIVQKHHGQIQVTSEYGKGTVFRIQLPVRQSS